MLPQAQLAAGIGQGEKDFDIQALVAQPAVEALNVSVLHCPTWPDEVQMNTVGVGPEIHRFGGKFGAVVQGDRLRRPSACNDHIQCGGNLLSAEGIVGVKRQALACADRRPSGRESSDHPAAVGPRNPCSTFRSCARPALAAGVDVVLVLSASVFARSIPPRHTGGRFAWRSLPNPRAAKGPSDAGSRSAHDCRPALADAPAVPHGAPDDARNEGSFVGPELASPHDAGSTRRSAGSTRQAHAAPEALQLFCDNLLQDMPIETEVRDQALQFAVLLAKLAQLPQLAQTQTGILPLPQIKALLADACLRQISTTVAPDSASRSTRRISSSPCPRFPISRFSFPSSENHGGQKLSTSCRLSFWVLGHLANQ